MATRKHFRLARLLNESEGRLRKALDASHHEVSEVSRRGRPSLGAAINVFGKRNQEVVSGRPKHRAIRCGDEMPPRCKDDNTSDEWGV